MNDVLISMTDDALAGFQSKLGPDTTVIDIARDALSLYSWAVEQHARGRLVLSCDQAGEDLRTLKLPSLAAAGAPPQSNRH
jgi:hypothetical protein